ncbi:progranulin-like isoform X2 [Nerophis lumbriciformis]|uniref:progranulin-like isoform X2 n=1 Tax=Nerophis lumbriciformis TaxID=546530 RepID=UPI002ADFC0D4|nr:progranulin-like isoform X2 [Nerophis lumbriciformis]
MSACSIADSTVQSQDAEGVTLHLVKCVVLIRHIQEVCCFARRREPGDAGRDKMLRFSVWLSFAALVSCKVPCPDRSVCSDHATCCQTEQGYSCCPYPKAVCCPDLANCCPPGFRCSLASQMCERGPESWNNPPLLARQAAVEPRVTPLRPVSHTSNLKKTAVTSVAEASGSRQELAVIRCDAKFYCPQGTSCCKGSSAGSWNCCPYPLGQCCVDGQHCCEYGNTCNVSPLSCTSPHTS